MAFWNTEQRHNELVGGCASHICTGHERQTTEQKQNQHDGWSTAEACVALLGGLKWYASFLRGIRVYGLKIDVGTGMKGEVGGVIAGTGQWTRCHCGVKGGVGDGPMDGGVVNIRTDKWRDSDYPSRVGTGACHRHCTEGSYVIDH
jgi:hypothetical protein